MSATEKRKNRNTPERAAKRGELPELLNAYLEDCKTRNGSDAKKKHFPNLAGFCRWMGCGVKAATALQRSYPELYDNLCAVLEDEALNSDLSPTVLTAYLKRRLGYSDPPEETAETDCGQLRLIFEHDIGEDGK